MRQKRLKQMVIAGGAACGKSYAVKFLLQRTGQSVLGFDADQVVHELYQNREVIEVLRDRFGESILSESGAVCRDQLLSLILANSQQRQWLEEFIHPQVAEARTRFAERVAEQKPEIRWIIAEIPLWFEKQVVWEADLSCLIGANREVQQARITQARGLSLSQAEALLELQWPSERKAPLADLVLWNDGSLASFQRQLEQVCSLYLYD